LPSTRFPQPQHAQKNEAESDDISGIPFTEENYNVDQIIQELDRSDQ